MRLIAEKAGPFRWDCRPEEQPEVSASAPLPHDAMRRLCSLLGLRAAVFVATERTPERVVFQKGVRELMEVCPECGGSGRYVGLNVIEHCRSCAGSGKI